MSSFAESLNNREKMLLCQFINEHNFNYTSVARSLSNHSLLVDKPAGYFTAENCESAYRDLSQGLDTDQWVNTLITNISDSLLRNSNKNASNPHARPQLILAKRYFKLHVEEIKKSIFEQEREFRAIVQDINQAEKRNKEVVDPSSSSSLNEPSTSATIDFKPATPQPAGDISVKEAEPIQQDVSSNKEITQNEEVEVAKESSPKDTEPMDTTVDEPENKEADDNEIEHEPENEESNKESVVIVKEPSSKEMEELQGSPVEPEEQPQKETSLEEAIPTEIPTEETKQEESSPARLKESLSPNKESIIDTPRSSEDMQIDQKHEEVKETRRTSKRKSTAGDTASKTPDDSINLGNKRKKLTLDDGQKKTQKILLLCLQEITAHKAGTIFTQPIRKNEAPGYYDVVYSPTDLSTIKKKIRDGQIVTIQQFRANILLMFANSIMYNPPSSDIHQMAQEMMKASEKLISEFLSNQD
ncbi:hypothetical protein E3Q11_03639 [Wallemia mellicola]|nr:hypothetical protein E3Q11_03639 [Wallemia mellicola]